MRNRLLFLWAAAADLAIDGLLGMVWFTVLVGLLTTGFGLIPAFGLGFLWLWGAAWVAAGIRFVERTRAEALYGVRIPVPVRRRSRGSGLTGWIGQLFLDVFDPALWKGLVHTFTTLLLGTLFWALLGAALDLVGGLGRGTVFGLELAVRGALPAILGALAALAALVLFVFGAGLLDRRLAVALLGSSRNAALEGQVDQLEDARRGAVDGAALERQRIERDLHDGVQPRLVAVAMTLGMARSKLDSDPAAARELLDEAHRETKESITELRHLARGIHPAVLSDRGLDAALSAVAEHCTVPTSVRVDLRERPGKEAEAVIYFAVSEALTNVSKHSRASGCSVSVTQTPTAVRAVVFDNGVGGASPGHGGGVGLVGMSDRVRAAGGTLTIDSPAGGPTILTVEVPCAS
ncbi:MAG: histidine kinase [Herbiconiux sp.]|nr:histidine kinase [Herbiconiux sp.]